MALPGVKPAGCAALTVSTDFYFCGVKSCFEMIFRLWLTAW